ncbi:uncharacterized protein LOC141571774 [Rhinolophus sinicus]|uniref:uncharacterized protein LOC141571774 n=1 Tax=Rhinolophus sinicus TaxID=89399 RepID=UPI003D79CE94
MAGEEEKRSSGLWAGLACPSVAQPLRALSLSPPDVAQLPTRFAKSANPDYSKATLGQDKSRGDLHHRWLREAPLSFSSKTPAPPGQVLDFRAQESRLSRGACVESQRLAVNGGERSQRRGPSRCARLGDPTALASAAQRLRTVPRAPSPPRPPRGPSEAPREEFQPFPLRRAVCGLLAARPQSGPRWGPGGAGQSQPRLAAARPHRPTRDSRPAAPRPGRPNRPFQQPRACLAPPGSGSSLRCCRPHRSPLPAPRARPPAAPVPAVPPTRPLQSPGSPQNPSLKLKLALASSPWGKSLSLSKAQFLLL